MGIKKVDPVTNGPLGWVSQIFLYFRFDFYVTFVIEKKFSTKN